MEYMKLTITDLQFHNPGPHLINPEFLDDRISVNTHTQV